MAGHLFVWRRVVAIELGIEFNKTGSARVGIGDQTDSPAGFVNLFNIHGQYNLDPLSHTELEMESSDNLLDLPDPSSIGIASLSDTSTEEESDSHLYSGIAGTNRPDSSAGEPETELTLASVAPVMEDVGSEPATPVSASAHEEQITGNAASASPYEEQVIGNAANASAHEEQVTGNAASASAHEEQVTGNAASASAHEEQVTGNAASTSAHEEQVTGDAASASAHEEHVTGNAASARGHEEQATGNPAGANEEKVTGNPVRASACEEQLAEIAGPEPASHESTIHVSSESATPASATAKGEEDAGPESATPANASPKEEQKTEDVRPGRGSPSPAQELVTEEGGSEPATPARASAEEEQAIGIVNSGDPCGAQQVDHPGIGSEEQDMVPHVEPIHEEVCLDNAGPSDTYDDEAIRPPNLVKLSSEDDLVRSSHMRELAGASDTRIEAQPDSKSAQLDIGSARTNLPELSAHEPEAKLILPSVEPEMEDHVDYADYADYEDYAGFSSGKLHIIPVVEPVMGVVAFNIAGPSHTNDDDDEILPPRGDLPSEDVRSQQVRPSSTELSGPSSMIGQEDLTRLPISEPRGTTPDIRTHSGRFSSRHSFVPSSIELGGLSVSLPELELDEGNADTEPADPVATEHAGPSNSHAKEQIILASVELAALEFVGSNPASSATASAEEEPGSDSGDPSRDRESFDTGGSDGSIEERLISSVEPETKEISFDDAGSSGTKNVEEIVEDLPSDQVHPSIEEEVILPPASKKVELDEGTADTADAVASEHAGSSDTPAEDQIVLASMELSLEIVGSNPASSDSTSAGEKPGIDSGDPSQGQSFDTAGASSVELIIARPSETKNVEEIVEELPSDQIRTHKGIVDSADPVATEHAGSSNTSADQHVILASVELALGIVGSNEEPGSDTGDPSGGQSFDTAGASSREERLIPSVEPKNKSIAFDEAGPSGTKNEEEIVEDLPSDQVHPDLAGASSPKGKRKLPPLRILLKPRDISEDFGSTGTPHCRNFCGSDDEDGSNRSSLDDLVELGCNCKGDMSRMCLKCLMKWFSPRILVQGKPECEICKAPLDESVRELMLSKYADPTGGGLELIEAVGQLLEREHNRRVRFMNARQGINFAWLLALTQGTPAPAPPALTRPARAPPTPEPLPVSTAPEVPLPPREPQPPQRRRRSFWRKLGKVFKCGGRPL